MFKKFTFSLYNNYNNIYKLLKYLNKLKSNYKIFQFYAYFSNRFTPLQFDSTLPIQHDLLVVKTYIKEIIFNFRDYIDKSYPRCLSHR